MGNFNGIIFCFSNKFRIENNTNPTIRYQKHRFISDLFHSFNIINVTIVEYRPSTLYPYRPIYVFIQVTGVEVGLNLENR